MNAAAPSRPAPHDLARWTLWIGRALLTIWVGFWIWFNVASGIGEWSDLGSIDLAIHLGFALGFLALGVVAWRWRLAGGIALLLASVGLAVFFHLSVPAILSAPPLLAGVLLIASHRLDARTR